MPDDVVRVEDNPEQQRYEVFVDDELAGFAQYHDGPGVRTLYHTVVAPSFGGRGVGSKLAAAALADVRARGLSVIVTCPFIADFVRRNPTSDPSARPAEEPTPHESGGSDGHR